MAVGQNGSFSGTVKNPAVVFCQVLIPGTWSLRQPSIASTLNTFVFSPVFQSCEAFKLP